MWSHHKKLHVIFLVAKTDRKKERTNEWSYGVEVKCFTLLQLSWLECRSAIKDCIKFKCMCVAFAASIFWFLYEWNALLENRLPHEFSVGRVESNALTSAQKSFIPFELAIKCVGQANIAVKSLWTVRMRTICTKESEKKWVSYDAQNKWWNFIFGKRFSHLLMCQLKWWIIVY